MKTGVDLHEFSNGLKLHSSDVSTSDSAINLFTELESIKKNIDSTKAKKSETQLLKKQNKLLDAKITNIEKQKKLEALEVASEGSGSGSEQ